MTDEERRQYTLGWRKYEDMEYLDYEEVSLWEYIKWVIRHWKKKPKIYTTKSWMWHEVDLKLVQQDIEIINTYLLDIIAPIMRDKGEGINDVQLILTEAAAKFHGWEDKE